MKLSQYAKSIGISYTTAFRHWKQGLLKGRQLPTGTIIIYDEEIRPTHGVVLYARVSSSENKDNLESQLQRLRSFATAKGYHIKYEIKEIGSGLNDKRVKLANILSKDDWSVLLVEHKDRLARFGLNYLEILLKKTGRSIEIINEVPEGKEDLIQDFVSIITSFTARLYGQRRSKRNTEKLIEELNLGK